MIIPAIKLSLNLILCTGLINDRLDVEIQYNFTHGFTDVEISCRPLTRMEGKLFYEIAYTMDPYSFSYNHSYTSESSVLLSLEPNKIYYFEIHTVGGTLDVKVLGTFETGKTEKKFFFRYSNIYTQQLLKLYSVRVFA